MTSFLSHAQVTDLKRRVTRALSPGKVGTFGGAGSEMSEKERHTVEVVLDALNDMHREGKL